MLVDEVLYSSLSPRESDGDYLFCFVFNEKNMGVGMSSLGNFQVTKYGC